MKDTIKKLLIISLIFGLSACGSKHEDDDKWLVATSADNPPYEYAERGEIKGFDIDLIKEIAKRCGKQVIFKNTDFQGLLAALASNNVDLVVAGMTPTEDRRNKVDFSIPYIRTKIAFLVKKDDNILSIEDLRGKKTGSQLGTIWANIAYELAQQYHFKNKTLSNNLMLVEELKLGRVDAVMMEQVQVEKLINKSDMFSSFEIDSISEFAIAMPKGSKLKQQIDSTIIEMEADGTMKILQEKWGLVSAY
ncbi:MAG: amino acid ABC transporter substrate-binding protein [Rickettsiaceae bacterium]|nr:amino acid ABC transporter substrate-binding protein [Rickettsiaceae bacterium]